MSSPTIDALAQALAAAHRDGKALDAAQWQAAVPDFEASYAVQAAVAEALGWFGGRAPGAWKSGGPGRDQPVTHAPLPPNGVRASPADYTDTRFHGPLIEIEIALRIGREVSAETAAALAARAGQADPAAREALGDRIADELVDAMCVAIEIVDSRWADPAQATAPMKLADLQSHGALALGEWMPYARRDWAAQRCEVTIGGAEAMVRTGTHPLGSPTWGLPVWLHHATRDGRSVPAGTVVTTGAWAGMPPARAGDLVTTRFDGIGSVRVQL